MMKPLKKCTLGIQIATTLMLVLQLWLQIKMLRSEEAHVPLAELED